MPLRKAEATWEGGFEGGKGSMQLGDRAESEAFDKETRFGSAPGSNPEELIGAALAGCFSMALAATLGQAGHEPQNIETSAMVRMEETDDGPTITHIDLSTRAKVDGIEEDEFTKTAENVKQSCPVAKALAGTTIELRATLMT